MRFKSLTRLLRSPFTALYDEAGLPQLIRRSLLFVILGNACANIFATVTGGSSLTGLAGALGANDLVFGVLTAIPLLGTLAQIPAALMVGRTGKRRFYMLTFGSISRALWIIVGLVPFIIPVTPEWLRIWTVIFLVGISSLCGSFINVSFTPWLADLVPIRIRGRWISSRDKIISLICLCFGLLSAALLDFMKDGYTGYTIVFVFGGILGVLDMFCFIFVDEVSTPNKEKIKFSSILKDIWSNKTFIQFIIFWTVWAFTSNMGLPYIIRYALGPLGLSFVQVTVCGQVAAALVTVLFISRWGRIIDRYGCVLTIKITCFLAAIMPIFMLFSTKGSPLMLLFYNLIGATFLNASNLTAQNLMLQYTPSENRPSYVAFYSCFTSIAGSFLGTLLGGAMLQWMPGFFSKIDFKVFGHYPDQYKVLFALCIVLRLLSVLLFIPRLKKDKDTSLSDMINGVVRIFRR